MSDRTKIATWISTTLAQASEPALADRLLLVQSGASRALGIEQFSGYIDPHLYGAKGDAFSAGDAAVTTSATAGDTVSTAQRDFISTDVGKKLWLGTNDVERTITAVVGTSARISPAYGSTATGLQLLCGTDDTVAIQAALDAAAINPVTGKTGPSTLLPNTYVRGGIPIGKTVRLRSGCGYIVGNTVASYDGGKKSALVLRRRTGLVGSGASFFGSALHLKPGSKGHVVGNENCEALTDYADFLTCGNFTIYCYADNWSPLSLDGFKLSVAADGFSKKDGFNRILAMHVYAAGRDGISLSGRGEFMCFDLNGFYCKRNGVRVASLDDSRLYHVVCGGNDKAGLHVSGGGPLHFEGGKSYYNGATGGTVDAESCNVCATTDNPYTGLVTFTDYECQESRGSAWVISARVKLVGCDAFDPGRDVSDLNQGTLPDDIAFYKLTGAYANNAIFDGGNAAKATLTNFSNIPGNTGNAKWVLFIDGTPAKNIGAIEYPEHVVLGTTALGNNPVTTANVSTTVTIASTAHGLATDDTVNISGLTATGGISAANLNGVHKITVVNANSYTFVASAAATSGATGGGAGGSVDKIIAGLTLRSDGGAKGGAGVSNTKNTRLAVNASACT